MPSRFEVHTAAIDVYALCCRNTVLPDLDGQVGVAVKGSVFNKNTISGILILQGCFSCDVQVYAFRVNQGPFIACANRRAVQCQGVGVGVKAGLAVAQDIVLVGAGDLLAAHPHGVFLRPRLDLHILEDNSVLASQGVRSVPGGRARSARLRIDQNVQALADRDGRKVKRSDFYTSGFQGSAGNRKLMALRNAVSIARRGYSTAGNADIRSPDRILCTCRCDRTPRDRDSIAVDAVANAVGPRRLGGDAAAGDGDVAAEDAVGINAEIAARCVHRAAGDGDILSKDAVPAARCGDIGARSGNNEISCNFNPVRNSVAEVQCGLARDRKLIDLGINHPGLCRWPADRGVIQHQCLAVGIVLGLAAAEDIVLVGAGDLHAAHPHRVGGDLLK